MVLGEWAFTRNEVFGVEAEEGGKRWEDRGAIRRTGWLVGGGSVVGGELQVFGSAVAICASISGCERPIRGTVEMLKGAVVPSR